MESKTIYMEMSKRMIEISGGLIGLSHLSQKERHDIFKRALLDYSIEKLDETAENKVIIEDLGYIFSRLNEQFTSPEEKEEFYSNYVHSILSMYNDLTNEKIIWAIPETETGVYPRFVDECGETELHTSSTTPNEYTALWLFRQYKHKLAETTQEKETPKQKTKEKNKRWKF